MFFARGSCIAASARVPMRRIARARHAAPADARLVAAPKKIARGC